MKQLAEIVVCLAALVGVLAFFGVRHHPAPVPAVPAPIIVPAPVPAPYPGPDDGRRRRPRPRLEDELDVHQVRPLETEEKAPDGTEPLTEYPDKEWFKNIGSKRDGAGMCVFTAFEFTCRYCGLDDFRGFRDWCAQRYPGGGYPEKLEKLVAAYTEAKHLPKLEIDQYEGKDPAWLERELHNGMLPGCTLYRSQRYGGGIIYHMTNCAHLDSKWGCTLDNNFQPLEWVPRDRWLQNIQLQGKYWGFALRSYGGKPVVGPPPSPKN